MPVLYFIEHIKGACKDLFQPYQHVSVDERMVASKGRSGIRQYMPDKPTKWGYKLWVIADSQTAYTYDFDVYVGAERVPSGHGLGYDVVMSLCSTLVDQGYHVYFDNFYTSPTLLKDLLKNKTFACGTTAANRKEFPKQLKKDLPTFKKGIRGSATVVGGTAM